MEVASGHCVNRTAKALEGRGRTKPLEGHLLQVSDTAMEFLQGALEQAGETEVLPNTDIVFRLIAMDDAYALKLDVPADGDVVFEREGAAILATTPDLAQNLGSVIDLEETSDGPRLVVVSV